MKIAYGSTCTAPSVCLAFFFLWNCKAEGLYCTSAHGANHCVYFKDRVLPYKTELMLQEQKLT